MHVKYKTKIMEVCLNPSARNVKEFGLL